MKTISEIRMEALRMPLEMQKIYLHHVLGFLQGYIGENVDDPINAKDIVTGLNNELEYIRRDMEFQAGKH